MGLAAAARLAEREAELEEQLAAARSETVSVKVELGATLRRLRTASAARQSSAEGDSAAEAEGGGQ